MKAFPFKSILLFWILLSISGFSQAQKYEKAIDKMEEDYLYGEYKNAISDAEKLRDKLLDDKEEGDYLLPQVILLEAKYHLGRGNITMFFTRLEEGVAAAAERFGDNSAAYADILLESAFLFSEYGNYRLARERLETAEKILKDQDAINDTREGRIKFVTAMVLSGQGFYNKAIKYIDEILPYYENRTADRVTTIDPETGEIDSEKLKKKERRERYREYAALRTQRAYLLEQGGKIHEADTEYALNEEWIEDNLSRKDLAYLKNRYLQWNMLSETLDTEKDVMREFSDMIDDMQKRHDKGHQVLLDIYESYMRYLLKNDEFNKYKFVSDDFQEIIKSRYNKASVYPIKLHMMDFYASLDIKLTGKHEASARNLLYNSEYIPENYPDRLKLLDYLYQVSQRKKAYQTGEQFIREMLTIKSDLYGEYSPEYHFARLKLANHLLNYDNDLEQAIKIYKESYFEVIEPEIYPQHPDYLEIQNNLALTYEILDDYEAANAALERSLNAARSKFNNTDKLYFNELAEIGKLQIRTGQYQQASENILIAEEGLKEYRKEDDDAILYVNALEAKTNLLFAYGFYEEAQKTLKQFRRTIKRNDLENEYDERQAVENMASLYATIGEYSKTEKLIEEYIAEEQERFGATSRRLINLLNEQAKIKLLRGDYPDTEKLARRANNIAIQIYGEQSTKTVPSTLTLANVYEAIGDLEKSKQHYRKAIDILSKRFGSDHLDVARSEAKLAVVEYMTDPGNQEIEGLLREAQDKVINAMGRDNPAFAEINKNLAIVLTMQGKNGEAFKLLDESARIWEERLGSRTIELANVWALKGDIYYQIKNYEKAREMYEQAMRDTRKIFSNQHPSYIRLMGKLSRNFYMQGEIKGSIDLIEQTLTAYRYYIREYFPALSEREKTKFWNTIKDDYEFFNTIALKHGATKPDMYAEMYNNAIQTKALLLNASIKILQLIASSTDEELKALYQEWVDKKELLTMALSMSDEELIENDINPAGLTQDTEQLEKEISQRSEIFAQSSEERAITWELIRNALKPNEVAVEMVRFRVFDHEFTDSIVYASIYITPESKKNPEVFLFENGRDLEGKYYNFYRNAIKYNLNDPLSHPQFWAAFEKNLSPSATIFLSPDGIFNQINLEAIALGAGKYVLDQSNIILVSNTKEIFIRKTRTTLVQKEKRATIFGNPAFYVSADGEIESDYRRKYGRVSQLPGTETEVENLTDLLTDNGWQIFDYMELEAKEDQVKALDNPKVFHIATHGFFTTKDMIEEEEAKLKLSENQGISNPMLRAGLMLTGAGDVLDKSEYNYNVDNGILTAFEAMSLNLDYTELVVLSACETGLGDIQAGEGVYGLQRAFLVAGAKTIIISLFKVSDAVTTELMMKFYQKWLETGDKRHSFTEAKKEIRNKYQDPIYWGPFIMIGLD